jgi:hypothetical protein
MSQHPCLPKPTRSLNDQAGFTGRLALMLAGGRRRTFLSWTDDGVLRQVVFQGLREDKPASDVRLDRPS